MIKKRKIIKSIQISLLFISLILIYLTYYNKKPPEKLTQAQTEDEKKNTFENVEYTGFDLSGNRFVIKSKNAEFDIDAPKLINMKNDNTLEKIQRLEEKIDRLQKSLTRLERKLSDHIDFIDRVYEPLRSPISKIKNFFG